MPPTFEFAVLFVMLLLLEEDRWMPFQEFEFAMLLEMLQWSTLPR